MPTYDYKCPSCDYEEEKIVHSTRRDSQFCSACGSDTRKLFTIGHLFVEHNVGKYDATFGAVVESSSHRKKLMKEQGVVDLVPAGQANRQIKECNSNIEKGVKRGQSERRRKIIANAVKGVQA